MLGIGLGYAITAYARDKEYSYDQYTPKSQLTLIQDDTIIKVSPAFTEPTVVKKTTKKIGLYPGEWGGQCVTFVKNYLGLSGTWGYGGRALIPNSGPEVGVAVLFYGHIGIVQQVTETQVQVIDSNYHYDEKIDVRWYDKDDPSIRGYHKF